MSKSTKKAMDNADDIIEKFGGIRPMSSKTDIPVTTIQGWKKRGKIPGARREEILKLAAQHKIDLNSLFFEKETVSNVAKDVPSVAESLAAQGHVVANENVVGVDSVEDVPVTDSDDNKNVKAPYGLQGVVALDQIVEDNLMSTIDKRIKAMEKRAVTKSTAISGLFVVLGLGALIAIFWPSVQLSEGDRLAALEQAVEDSRASQNRLESSQNVLQQAQASLEDRAQQAFSGLSQRASAGLEDGLERLSQSGAMVVLSEQFAVLEQSGAGRAQLEAASAEMGALFEGLQGVKHCCWR